MRLGLITTMADHPWGGSEELWLCLANVALDNNHQVFASIYNWGNLPNKVFESQKKGLKVFKRERISYSTLIGKIKGKIVQKTIAKNQLHSFVKKSNPDFLLISMGAFCDIEIDPFRSFLKETKLPYALIAHVNTEDYKIDPLKINDFKKVVKKAKRIFFVSKRILQQAERQLGFAFINSDIIVNPVNMDKIGILPYLDKDTANFACVGRLKIDVKGQALLIEVLSSEKWKNRDWILNIYGTGPDEKLIKEQIEFFNLQDKILLKGFVKDVRKEIWNDNHLLVMPSYFEGLPMALIEAMLSGRSAIATDVGGNSEVIIDGVTGFIAREVSLNSIDKVMDMAWSKRSDWKKMGKAAYDESLKYFGDNPEKELLKQIEKMISIS